MLHYLRNIQERSLTSNDTNCLSGCNYASLLWRKFLKLVFPEDLWECITLTKFLIFTEVHFYPWKRGFLRILDWIFYKISTEMNLAQVAWMMNVCCKFCGALHFKLERLIGTSASNPYFSECCSKGKVYFSPLPPPHPYLLQILTEPGTRDRTFQNNKRGYNTHFPRVLLPKMGLLGVLVSLDSARRWIFMSACITTLLLWYHLG